MQGPPAIDRWEIVTVAELIEILQRLPASARVIVQGYGSRFNDATSAAMLHIMQMPIAWGSNRPRLCQKGRSQGFEGSRYHCRHARKPL
jgi:hypothetical protein